jgi:RNA polymerase sigma-70 factor (ECF subfamily)
VKELILNEEELIRRCTRNDRHAQEFLFNQFYKDLYLVAMRYLSDHHDAEDAIIKSYTRVFKSLNSFTYKGQGSLGRWVRTILINESIRLIKKRNLIQFNEDVKYLDVQNSDANGLQQLQASDITRMIEKLPTGYRTVFNLFVVEGYSHKEIAHMLNISDNTSKTQLKKARNHLMSSINEEKNYGTI